MKPAAVCLAAIAVCAVCSTVHALYEVADEGTWPKTWPAELEPLRKQARTLVGPMLENRHYEIPFTKREKFEAAWPHLLKVKSRGAPIILVKKTTFFRVKPAGVLVHTPPVLLEGKKGRPEEPIPAQDNPRTTWMNTSFIELVVDGEIVDLNRIALPADTPIIDERFDDGRDPSMERRGD